MCVCIVVSVRPPVQAVQIRILREFQHANCHLAQVSYRILSGGFQCRRLLLMARYIVTPLPEIETCVRCGRNELDHNCWQQTQVADEFLCSQCEQQSLVATFAFHFAVPQLDKESSLRIHILTFLYVLPIRLQRRRTLRKLLQGRPWTTNDMWQCRQAFEAQLYGSISRVGRVYRIRRGRRLDPDHDFFDLVMDFLI